VSREPRPDLHSVTVRTTSLRARKYGLMLEIGAKPSDAARLLFPFRRDGLLYGVPPEGVKHPAMAEGVGSDKGSRTYVPLPSTSRNFALRSGSAYIRGGPDSPP